MPTDYRIGRLNGGFVVSWWGEDGKRRRYRLDAQSRTEAESQALALVREKRAAAAGQTIGELWELYREEKKGRRVAVAMDFEWRKMAPFFANLRPEQVTTDHCRAYADARRQMGKKDGTIWTELGHLRTVLRWSLDRRLTTFAPPIERPQKPAPKDRWLTTAEADRLVDAAKEHHIRLAILLMLETAGRVGAILELTWDRVDFSSGHINLRTTDIGPRKGRAVVPMNKALRGALARAKDMAMTDHVIEWSGRPVASIKTGFQRAAKDAGLKAVTPHTLRHTAAVHLVSAGVPMQKVAQYLGHSSTFVTERTYARYAPDHMRDEAAVLDFASRVRVV